MATWNVTEGARHDVVGAWNVNEQGNIITGNAVMNAPQGQITYGLTGVQNGNTFNIFRVNPSDGVMVAYTGTDNGTGVITGQGLAPGLTVPWVAVIV